MITLKEACDTINKQVGRTCGIVSCKLIGDYYVFTVHRRNTGVYEHDGAIYYGHFINKNTGTYQFVEPTEATDYFMEHETEQICNPFPFMNEEDIEVAKQIIKNVNWAS